MNPLKSVIVTLTIVTASACIAADPTITSVTAQQRYPWNGKVDISYKVTGDIAATAKERGLITSLKVTATDKVANKTYTATKLSGDRALTAGTHSFVWDLDAEGLLLKSTNVVFTVACEKTPALYCVIDLSAGANATSYAVSYMSAPPSGGFNVDAYKTTKLVLRRIESGSFKMCGQYNVTLTKPFYCAVFEMTQKQYKLVVGSNPSYYSGDKRPVEGISYKIIRGSSNGAKWPSSSSVDSSSIMGKLRSRTGLAFDIPTEAQWEYACRAGTTSKFNNGGDSESDLKKLGRYSGNVTDGKGGYSSNTTTVGSYLPNAWGLYDMHGNVIEWCLDWYSGSLTNNVVDPKGPSSGSQRAARGGSWYNGAVGSPNRDHNSPTYADKYYSFGIRLCRTLSVADTTGSLCSGVSSSKKVDIASGARIAAATEQIQYSTNWVSGAASGATAVVAVGNTTLKSATGSGSVNWTPAHNTTYTLTHKVMSGGTQVGSTLTATFQATNVRYVVTWKDEDGSILKTESVLDGTMPVYGGVPTKDPTNQYAFAGWTPAVSSVTGAATYTATYVLLNPEAPVISPASGTTFDSTLSVSMTCPTEGANIYYTTNGADPTVESTAYQRFRIYGKTTVKAIAEKNGLLSEIATAEYALGRCGDPVISLEDGMEFAHSNQVVSIRRRGKDREGVLRYTLDGSDPTSESPVYEGPFVINDSIEVKAKVFSDLYFDSAIVTSSLVRVWENVATPVIDSVASFTGSKAKVVISSATEGASIYYTLDGSVPDTTSAVYTGPIYVTDSCTVKAYAVMPDYLNSAVAAQGVEKVWVIGDALGKPDHVFTTDGDDGSGWIKVDDATAPNGEAMRSGAITHGQSSVLATTVVGPGTLTFSWRTSCEEDALQEWDHVELSVDDTVVQKLDGITAWTNETVRIEGDGEHIVEWRYVKDYVESVGEDAAWVAGYGWVSDYTETQTTDVPVPYTWLRHHDPEIIDEYDAYEAAASAMAANGRNRVWECYAIGLNPTLATSNFRITAFPMKEDGTPDLANIVFEPAQAQWNVLGARAILKGAAELAGPWVEIPANDGGGTASSQGGEPVPRFFKMEVILP